MAFLMKGNPKEKSSKVMNLVVSTILTKPILKKTRRRIRGLVVGTFLTKVNKKTLSRIMIQVAQAHASTLNVDPLLP